MAECPNKERNLKMCTCTYTGCDKTGVCCECIAYHRRMKQLPGCLSAGIMRTPFKGSASHPATT